MDNLMNSTGSSNDSTPQNTLTKLCKVLNISFGDDKQPSICSIFGPSRAGTTWLLERFIRIATNEFGVVYAKTDKTEFEGEKPILRVMRRLAEQLDKDGFDLKKFQQKLKRFLRPEDINQERENSIAAAEGISQSIFESAPSLTKNADLLKLFKIPAKAIPQLDLGITLLSEASSAGLKATKQLSKIRSKDPLFKLQDELSSFFLAELNKIAAKHPIILIFDDYNQFRSQILDRWLENLLIKERYGKAPENILWLIAGRQKLKPELSFSPKYYFASLPIEPLTLEETREYLSHRKITDEQVVQQIFELSSGFPEKLNSLANSYQNDPNTELFCSYSTIVDVYLKGIDAQQRDLSIQASIPRQFNRDILCQIVSDADAGKMFEWLRKQPFVEEKANGWSYKKALREELLAYYLSAWGKQSWIQLHGQFGDYYNQLQNHLDLESETEWQNQTWQNYATEEFYHRLCQKPHQYLPNAINSIISPLEIQPDFALAKLQALVQAGEDSKNEKLSQWGYQLDKGLSAYFGDVYEIYNNAAELFNKLLVFSDLEQNLLPIIYRKRGQIYTEIGKYEQALDDLSKAIELEPNNPQGFASRGVTYIFMEHYEDALINFTQAINLKHDQSWVFNYRGIVYQALEQYDEAIDDFTTAIKFEPENIPAMVNRGVTYQLIGQIDRALVDLNNAISQETNPAWIFTIRGRLYLSTGQYEEALNDFDCSINLYPDNLETLGLRGITYRLLEHYDEALANFNQALEQEPNNLGLLAERATTYQMLKQWDRALNDYNRAVELEPDNLMLLSARYFVLTQKGEFTKAAEAIAELENKIPEFIQQRRDIFAEIPLEILQKSFEQLANSMGLSPTTAQTMTAQYQKLLEAPLEEAVSVMKAELAATHARAYLQQNQIERALAAQSRALELEPTQALYWAARGSIYQTQGDYNRALADLNHAIELEPENEVCHSQRAQTYMLMGKSDLALADINRAIELNPHNLMLLSVRLGILIQIGDFAEAAKTNSRLSHHIWQFLQQMREAVGRIPPQIMQKNLENWVVSMELPPTVAQQIITRFQSVIHEEDQNKVNQIMEAEEGYLLALEDLQQQKLNQALAHINQAIELDESNAFYWATRGEIYLQREQYDLAIADMNYAIQQEPNNVDFLFNRAEADRQINRLNQALDDFSKIIELEPNNIEALANRGLVYRDLSLYEEALADFNRAIALSSASDPVWLLYNRGLTYALMAEYSEALADFNQALELEPDNTLMLELRGITYKAVNEFDKALADFNRIIDLEPDNANAIAQCGLIDRAEGRLDKALDELERAVEIDRTWTRDRGITHLKMGHYLKAFRDIMTAPIGV